MSVLKDVMKAVQSLDILNENQGVIGIRSNDTNCSDVMMSSREALILKQQEYYNKASGCSVRAQKDNFFDYKSGLKK